MEVLEKQRRYMQISGLRYIQKFDTFFCLFFVWETSKNYMKIAIPDIKKLQHGSWYLLNGY